MLTDAQIIEAARAAGFHDLAALLSMGGSLAEPAFTAIRAAVARKKASRERAGQRASREAVPHRDNVVPIGRDSFRPPYDAAYVKLVFDQFIRAGWRHPTNVYGEHPDPRRITTSGVTTDEALQAAVTIQAQLGNTYYVDMHISKFDGSPVTITVGAERRTLAEGDAVEERAAAGGGYAAVIGTDDYTRWVLKAYPGIKTSMIGITMPPGEAAPPRGRLLSLVRGGDDPSQDLDEDAEVLRRSSAADNLEARLERADAVRPNLTGLYLDWKKTRPGYWEGSIRRTSVVVATARWEDTNRVEWMRGAGWWWQSTAATPQVWSPPVGPLGSAQEAIEAADASYRNRPDTLAELRADRSGHVGAFDASRVGLAAASPQRPTEAELRAWKPGVTALGSTTIAPIIPLPQGETLPELFILYNQRTKQAQLVTDGVPGPVKQVADANTDYHREYQRRYGMKPTGAYPMFTGSTWHNKDAHEQAQRAAHLLATITPSPGAVILKNTPNEKAFVDVKPGKSIRIYGVESGRRPYDRTFHVGDEAVESAYNLAYFGTIKSITARNVIVQKKHSDHTRRMDFERFTLYNWDLEAQHERNRNWSD